MNRRELFGGIAASLLALSIGAGAASAEEDTVNLVGNGGVANAEANGGDITLVENYLTNDSYVVLGYDAEGNVVYAHTVYGTGGGTAIADASGGSNNEVNQ